MERDKAYLLDILEAAKLALRYVENKSEATFLQDVQLQDSVVRRIEIIGEASRRISAETRESFPEIPWSEMISMRNLMIHDYDDIDLKVVWQTLQTDLPTLILQLTPILDSES